MVCKGEGGDNTYGGVDGSIGQGRGGGGTAVDGRGRSADTVELDRDGGRVDNQFVVQRNLVVDCFVKVRGLG